MGWLIKNGTVVTGTTSEIADVRMEGGKIAEIGRCLREEGCQVYDAAGKYLFPGFIDGHTHFDLEVANTVTADDFESGTKAAIVGGTTMVIDFATQNKGETLKEAMQSWHAKADSRCSCDYGFHMAISDWNKEVENELQEMIAAGITSFKLYMTYPAMILDDGQIYEVLRALKRLGCFAGVHCENAPLIDALIREAREEGQLGPKTHPLVRPPEMEAEAVHRLMTIAREANAPVMIVHLTCEAAYKEVRAARAAGQTVYVETCPQYLLLDDSVYEKHDFEGAKYVCSPPIRKKKDQEILWSAIKNDQIQTIATDHCSFSTEQKEMGREDFTKIPNGMPGVETRGELLFTYGVQKGRISLEQFCRLLSENPAKLYGVYPQKGIIAPGSDADLVIIDPRKNKVITAANQMYHMDYAPFEGTLLEGAVEKVFLRGALVVDDGKLLVEKEGMYISRGKNLLSL